MLCLYHYPRHPPQTQQKKPVYHVRSFLHYLPGVRPDEESSESSQKLEFSAKTRYSIGNRALQHN